MNLIWDTMCVLVLIFLMNLNDKAMIKVLWIDDEYTEEDVFIGDALEEDIKIIGSNNSDEGLEKLEANLDFFDAIILDAYTYKRKGDTVPALEGFYDAQNRIFRLSAKKQIPCFIYSGNTAIKQQDPRNLAFPKFDKGDRSEKLFKAIKEAVANQPENQLRSKHEQVFSLFTPEYLGKKAERYLIDCLLQLDQLTVGLNKVNEDYFNRLRKIVEALFHSLYRRRLLPKPILKGSHLHLYEASKFMIGEGFEDNNIMYSLAEEARFPKAIANSVFYLIHRTNFGSHFNDFDSSGENETDNEAELREYEISPYLLHSLTYQMMDVLNWYKYYADRYQIPEENSKLIQAKETDGTFPPITGRLQHDGTFYHVKDCTIYNPIVKAQEWKIGDYITLTHYKPSNKDNGYRYFCGSYKCPQTV
jgi:hypothetical protein